MNTNKVLASPKCDIVNPMLTHKFYALGNERYQCEAESDILSVYFDVMSTSLGSSECLWTMLITKAAQVLKTYRYILHTIGIYTDKLQY
jgi:hypothetical protein